MRPDLRLLLPAAACWLAAALAPGLRPATALAAAAALVALAALTMLGRHAAVGLVVILLAAAAGLASSGVRQLSRTEGPLAALATQGADVVVRVQLTGDPVARSGIGTTGRPYHLVIVPVAVTRVETDVGRAWSLRQPMLVLAVDDHWLGLLPSQSVTAAGALAPPRGGDDVAAVLDARGPPERIGPPSTVQRAAGRVRAGLQAAAAPLPGQPAALLPALVDGDTSRLSATTTGQFRVTGLTHLVAVSGENLAVVTGVTLGVVRRLRVGPRATAVVTALAIAGFVVLARPSASVLRAAVMGGIGLAALAGGRRRPALGGLAGAVLVLVLAEPDLARQPGFALSVLASLGLLVIAPGLAVRLAHRMPTPLATAIAVPVAAQLACTPVIAAIGGGVGLVAVPANLLAAPAVAPATVLGVLAAVAAPLSRGLAEVCAVLGWLPCGWLVLVARVGSRVPAADVAVPSGWPGAAAGTGLVAAVLIGPTVLRRLRRRRRAILPACPTSPR